MTKCLSFLFIIAFFSCNDPIYVIPAPPLRTYHIPDPANSFDYTYYVRKNKIIKQLNSIRLLEKDSARTDVRLWVMTAGTNLQKVYMLKKRDSRWTVSMLNYYINPSMPDKVDSIAMDIIYQKELSPQNLQDLTVEKMWGIPSQGEMKNSSSFACRDSSIVLVEMCDETRYKFSAYNCPDLNAGKDSAFAFVHSFLNKMMALQR